MARAMGSYQALENKEVIGVVRILCLSWYTVTWVVAEAMKRDSYGPNWV